MAESCDPNALAQAAKCFKCLPPEVQKQVQTYLLCQILNNGGTGGGGGGGTVTSFSAGDLSPLFTTTETNPTTTPALSFAQIAQAANLIFGGPGSGAAANPTFRALVAADLGTTMLAQFLAIREAESAIAAANIDWALGGVFTKALAANTVFTFSNVTAGRVIKVIITGDAASTVTWPAVVWPGGVSPTQTLSKVDVYTFLSRASGTIYGSVVQNMS